MEGEMQREIKMMQKQSRYDARRRAAASGLTPPAGCACPPLAATRLPPLRPPA